MTEFLVPRKHSTTVHYHDPYSISGARSILRRFKSDVVTMIDTMIVNEQTFEEGYTQLAKSPLRNKVWVAAAMKTLGLIIEIPSESGACILKLTDKAKEQLTALQRY